MILPLFTSHYSLPQNGSLLTLEESHKSKGGPVSVFDLAEEGQLKQVVLADDRIDGFVQAYKSAEKAKVQLIFGLKLVVCANMVEKNEDSLRTESKVIIFAKNTQGYHDLLKIHNPSAVDGFYHNPRADWKLLKERWTDNLILGLPFFSSFVAKNALTFSRIVPDLPATPWVFREIDSQLPFAPLIDEAINLFAKPESIVPCKSIYYARCSDFAAYQTLRAIGNRSSFNSPDVDHLASDRFSFEAWKEINK